MGTHKLVFRHISIKVTAELVASSANHSPYVIHGSLFSVVLTFLQLPSASSNDARPSPSSR